MSCAENLLPVALEEGGGSGRGAGGLPATVQNVLGDQRSPAEAPSFFVPYLVEAHLQALPFVHIIFLGNTCFWRWGCFAERSDDLGELGVVGAYHSFLVEAVEEFWPCSCRPFIPEVVLLRAARRANVAK